MPVAAIALPFTECTARLRTCLLYTPTVFRKRRRLSLDWIGLDHGRAERAPCVLSMEGERGGKGKSYLPTRRSAFSVSVQPSMAPNESLVERNETSTSLSPRILAPVA